MTRCIAWPVPVTTFRVVAALSIFAARPQFGLAVLEQVAPASDRK